MPIHQAHEFFIQWHLTERCNLRCIHCYQTESNMDELSLFEAKEVVSEVSDMIGAWSDAYDISFSPSFNVTGGEPFLRADLFDILDEISSRGFEVHLLTNGVLVTRERAERLLGLGVRGVQVSIEGPEEIHERIRGKGTFSSSMEGVGHLLGAGLRVTLNVTLSNINAPFFIEIVRLASSLGVQRLGFSRLVPSGRGAGLLDHMLSKAEVKELYERISSLRVDALEIVTGDPVASQMPFASEPEDMGSVPLGGCAAGTTGLTLLPDGTITPCRRLYIPVGNVRRDSLREVWSRSEVLWQLRDRKSYKGRCGTCKRWASCRGCRAISYAGSGWTDFLAEDPQCFIEAGEQSPLLPSK
jgi:AdoMet-dependent heme synthase